MTTLCTPAVRNLLGATVTLWSCPSARPLRRSRKRFRANSRLLGALATPNYSGGRVRSSFRQAVRSPRSMATPRSPTPMSSFECLRDTTCLRTGTLLPNAWFSSQVSFTLLTMGRGPQSSSPACTHTARRRRCTVDAARAKSRAFSSSRSRGPSMQLPLQLPLGSAVAAQQAGEAVGRGLQLCKRPCSTGIVVATRAAAA